MALVYEPHLMQLSDDVLLHMMSFLNSKYELITLSQVCCRFDKISRDRTLWRKADLRHDSFKVTELKKAVQCVHKGTKLFASRGWGPQSTSEGEEYPSADDLFETVMRVSNLETLILESHRVNATRLPYSSYPQTLRHLSLENCEVFKVPEKKSYFFNMATITPELESLNLNGCHWFEDHSLMAISKCVKLRKLQLRNCPMVGSCSAYIMLAARFGFNSLEVLDLRETAVGDSEVHAFQSKLSLKQLYIDGSLHRKKDSHEMDRVADRGIYALGECTPNLQVLALTNTEVSDVTLRHISRNIPWLQMLDVRGTKVTQEGVRLLEAECPNLMVLSNWNISGDDEVWSAAACQDWLMDRCFVEQQQVPRECRPQSPACVPQERVRPERIEVVFVEHGMVRIRRIIQEHEGLLPQEQQQQLVQIPQQPAVIDRIEFVDRLPPAPEAIARLPGAPELVGRLPPAIERLPVAPELIGHLPAAPQAIERLPLAPEFVGHLPAAPGLVEHLPAAPHAIVRLPVRFFIPPAPELVGRLSGRQFVGRLPPAPDSPDRLPVRPDLVGRLPPSPESAGRIPAIPESPDRILSAPESGSRLPASLELAGRLPTSPDSPGLLPPAPESVDGLLTEP